MRLPNPNNRPLSVHAGDIIEGRYQIIDLLDIGGMGAVFLAEHLLLKRRLAIKVLHVELARDIAMVQRFMNEAHAAGTLGHPNIVEATDMGFADELTPYIVFEYLEGALLTEEIYRVGGMAPRRALAIARQIASALDATHTAGIVHLDLKCDNVVLVDKNGAPDHATVIDFGISKFLEPAVEITQPSVPMGTPEFMAPEQVETPDLVDSRADIYALGVCLYEMLSARRPFSSDDPRTLFHRIVHEAAPPLARPEVPAPLEAFVFELLAKDPAERPPTMRAVLDRIDEIELAAQQERRASRARKRAQPATVAPAGVEPGPVEPAPVAVARPYAPPRPSLAPWIIALLVAAGAGGALHYIDVMGPEVRRAYPPPSLQIEAEARQLSLIVGAQLRTVRLRADSIARTPMLRAAIETDEATVGDLLRSESILEPIANETIEIFRAQAGELHSLARAPTHAAPLAVVDAQRVVETTNGVVIEVSSPIANASTEVAGLVVVAAFFDLVPLRAQVAAHAREFVAAAMNPAVIDVTEDSNREFIRYARTASFALAGVLLLLVGWVVAHRD